MDRAKEIIEDFLASKTSLIQNALTSGSGLRTTHKYADLMDRFIRALFLEAGLRDRIREVQRDGLCVIALGGYGRRELCISSDVDLMVIHQGMLSNEIGDIISRALYPLWDAKLEVGHSILTIPESIRLAINDFKVLTSLIDARFLLGSTSFHRLFEEAFWSRIDREKDSLLHQFLLYQKRREDKYGTEGYFVEPDIKEGLGGLRDLHFMAWLARIYFKSKRFSHIKRFQVFSYFDLDKLNYSKSFLLKVRNQLHLLAGRKEDRLFLSYQEDLPRNLGYQDTPYFTGPERFMKDIYLHLNRMRYGHEEFQTKVLDIILPSPSDSVPTRLPQDFEMIKGNIVLKVGYVSEKDPVVILKALHEANQKGLFLDSEFIWEATKKVAKEKSRIVASQEAKALFLKIVLDPKNPKIIRLALEMGLIGLFIPEFMRIRNLGELDYYHVETVDLHSLRTLEAINEISKGTYDDRWPMFKDIYEDLEHPPWLFLAGLLHDIGKGRGGDHSEKGSRLIPGILKRLGIDRDALDVIPFVVKHHLLLARISQQRDLNDEKTAVRVAQIIQDKDILKILFLLTVADSFATGPIARSEWKIMLLMELFFKVRHILERGTLTSPDATSKIETNKGLILDGLEQEFLREEILNLMDQVPEGYFLNTTLEDMVQHFLMALNMGKEKLSWNLHRLKHAPVTRIILCIKDKPGLFSKMVGVFTLNNIKVLSANIFTLKNGLAFDTYEVTNPVDPFRESERWEKIYEDIVLALEDRLPLDELIERKGKSELGAGTYLGPKAKKVKINNEISDFFTAVEISSEARIGLLYDSAKKIFSLGLDIRFAKINNDQEKIMGVFYVRDSEGQKVHDKDRIEEIQQMMLDIMV